MDIQEQFLEAVVNGKNCFLTGGGGVGKTFTINQMIGKLTRLGRKIDLTASTGIAATVQDFGMTIHRWAQIGIAPNKEALDHIMMNEYFDPERIMKARILVIDEISMLKPDQLDLLDVLFKAVRGNKKPFGGIQMIFVGDFLQLPPVYTKEDNVGPEYFWAFDAVSWKEADVNIFHLTEVKRQDNQDFIRLLNEIRMGELSELAKAYLPKTQYNKFGDIQPVKLVATNKIADKHNSMMLNSFRKSESWHKQGFIKANSKQAFFDVQNKTLAPRDLLLKENCQVMILKNDPEGFYANGSMGVFKGFSMQNVQVAHYGGNEALVECAVVELFDGKETVFVPKFKYEVGNDSQMPDYAYMEQFPIRPAYAITIHKSQGLTLDYVELECRKIFAEAQLYVALSRVRTPKGLRCLNFKHWHVKANKRAVQFYEDLGRPF